MLTVPDYYYSFRLNEAQGNILSQLTPAWMDLRTQSLHDIEGAFEIWKQLALPEIEADLLNLAQSRFTQEIKKPEN